MKREYIDSKDLGNESKYICNFTFFTTEGQNKGEYFSIINRSEIYLAYHEKLNEITNTIEHEDLHRAIDFIGESNDMTMNQEHDLIKCLLLIGDDLIL